MSSQLSQDKISQLGRKHAPPHNQEKHAHKQTWKGRSEGNYVEGEKQNLYIYTHMYVFLCAGKRLVSARGKSSKRLEDE